MINLQVSTNTEFGEVRTMMRDGEPWFVAADVCRALDILNPRDATARLDEDEKNTVVLTDGNRGNPNVTIINEPGLYALVLGSRKPEAKAFKRWITHEVIPAIRKNGAYLTPEGAYKLLSDPDNIIQMLTAFKEKSEECRELTAENGQLRAEIADLERENDICKRTALKHYAKSMWADRALEDGENLCIREAAKEIGVKETDFTRLLVELKYLYRNPKRQNRLFPYSAPKCQGVFTVKMMQVRGAPEFESQTLITPVGRAKLTAECVRAGLIKRMPEEHDVLEVW